MYRAAAVMVVVLFSGCLGGDGPRGDSTSTTSATDDRNVLSYRLTDCREVATILFVPRDTAAAAIPPEFTPTATPVTPFGQTLVAPAAVELGSFHCNNNTLDQTPVQWGTIAVLVEPPDLEHDLGPADVHSYEVARYTDLQGERAFLSAMGHTVDAARTTVSVGEGAAPASMSLTDSEGELFNSVARRGDPWHVDNNTYRAWHKSSSGIVATDYQVSDVDGWGGNVIRCESRPGSLAERPLGGSCSTRPGVAELVDDLDRDVTLRTL